MNRKKRNKSNSANKKPYRGPYQPNPNMAFENIRKSMKTETEGPTVDTFSTLDSTTNMLPNEENDVRRNTESKRPTKERSFSISKENIFFTVFGIIATGIGIIVYTHSGKFVSIEKDFEYLRKDTDKIEGSLDGLNKTVIQIDKKVDLIDQKIELKNENIQRTENKKPLTNAKNP